MFDAVEQVVGSNKSWRRKVTHHSTWKVLSKGFTRLTSARALETATRQNPAVLLAAEKICSE